MTFDSSGTLDKKYKLNFRIFVFLPMYSQIDRGVEPKSKLHLGCFGKRERHNPFSVFSSHAAPIKKKLNF